MRKVAFLIIALAAGGCGSVDPIGVSTVGPQPTTTPVAATPTPTDATGPTVTPRPTPTPVLGAPCPSSSPLTVFEVVDADPECFHGDFSVTGWLDFPPAMGWEGPLVKPEWLYYPPDQVLSAIWSTKPIEPDHFCAANVRCAWFFIHIAPDSSVSPGRTPQYVVLTGHLNDPASATCHYVPEPSSQYVVHDEDAVHECESQFVVTSIKLLGTKPA